MLNPDLPMLFCLRVADVPKGMRVPPEVRRTNCRNCDCRILVSPGGRILVESGLSQPVCEPCYRKIERLRGVKFSDTMTPQQVDECGKYTQMNEEKQ
jgi:hypothetical protein